MAELSKKILTIFGTRPEIIKLAPVIQQLDDCGKSLQTVNVTSAQHTDLLYPFVRLFGIRIDEDLRIMEPNQTPNQVCSRVLAALDPILARERPDMILVQGDTTTAMSGALAGFHQRVPVAHVEAGLRTGDAYNPYPEEMNRRIITRLATFHFAATARNRETLLSEGVPDTRIFVTGNPVLDSLKTILERSTTTPVLEEVLTATAGLRRIILTTHRRESFGPVMTENFRVLRSFIDRYDDIGLIFPVHPNPAVIGAATCILGGHPRIHLIRPLSYEQFIVLLSHAWFIVSDSGGIQEEAPTLRKPLLVLRKNTERPEAVASGVARLVGGSPERLGAMLEEMRQDGSWLDQIKKIPNPFGEGDSGKRIAQLIARLLSEVHDGYDQSGN
jgi:UDP-N-acetylglucosamine 2-epimerase (non-hydrolysing)